MKELIMRFVCRHFHGLPFHPIHEKYVCPVCLREHPVQWDIKSS